MEELFTFDDVLILPQFSSIASRKDVSLQTDIFSSLQLDLPVISANMDTITGVTMAKAMSKAGGAGCLHRFWSVEENVRAYLDAASSGAIFVSFGLGEAEIARVQDLYVSGARYFILDVAHAAQLAVARQFNEVKRCCPQAFFIVGNFGTVESINAFLQLCPSVPDALKVGIGPGSACTTRIKSGCGVPQLSAVQSCRRNLYSIPIIADGGMRTPGDIAKALAAGASAVMIGGMLAGTDETPGDVLDKKTMSWADQHHRQAFPQECVKKYRGSASKESYEAQGKDRGYITAEGESFTVAYKGQVSNVLQDIEGGLRSAFTYVGASNLKEFQEKAKFARITGAGIKESGAHGKS